LLFNHDIHGQKLKPLDAAVFPLVNTPTPSALKKFCFDLNGVPTNFKELDLFESEIEKVYFIQLTHVLIS
jgi:F-box and WD-40 domain protein CDC4